MKSVRGSDGSEILKRDLPFRPEHTSGNLRRTKDIPGKIHQARVVWNEGTHTSLAH